MRGRLLGNVSGKLFGRQRLSRKQAPECVAKKVRVLSIVESELKFANVCRQMLARDLVVTANDSALEQAPERFHRVCMDRSNNILALGVLHDSVIEVLTQEPISRVFIGRNERHSLRDSLADKGVKGRRVCDWNHTRPDSVAALHTTDDDHFSNVAASTWNFLVPMAIGTFPAYKRFIKLRSATMV